MSARRARCRSRSSRTSSACMQPRSTSSATRPTPRIMSISRERAARSRRRRARAYGRCSADPRLWLPARRAFPEERVHALTCDIARHVGRDRVRRVRVRRAQVLLELAIEQRLAEREDLARLGLEGRREVMRRLHQTVFGHDAIHETPLERGGRRDELAGEEHFRGALAAEVARDRDRGRRTEEAEVDSRGGEARVVGGDREVALRDQLAAGGGRDAVDRGDDGLGQGDELLHHRAARDEERLDLRLGMRAHLLQVMAGAESAARAGDDDDTNRFVRGDRVELAMQRLEERLRERVVLPRPVEDEDRDRILRAAKEHRLGACGGCRRLVVHRTIMAPAPAPGFALPHGINRNTIHRRPRSNNKDKTTMNERARFRGMACVVVCATLASMSARAEDPAIENAKRLLAAGNARQAYAELSAVEDRLTGMPEFDYLLGVAALESGRVE